MGVDNENQIKNEKLRNDFLFLSKIVKPITNSQLKDKNVDEAKAIIDNSQIIITFGMSIGPTDKTWWDYITNWLILDEKRRLIIFYYDDTVDRRIIETILDMEELVKNKYLNLIDPNQNVQKEQLISRIHIVVDQKDMFKIDLISD